MQSQVCPPKREAEGDLTQVEWREAALTTHTAVGVVQLPEAERCVEWGPPRTSPGRAPHPTPNTHVDFSPVILSLDSGLRNGQNSVVLGQQVVGTRGTEQKLCPAQLPAVSTHGQQDCCKLCHSNG